MRHEKTDSNGSFVAWGIGFNYEYNSDSKTLNIVGKRYKRPLLRIDFDDFASKDPLGYIQDINKASQIYALMFSNNTTLDLAELFETQKLASILENSAKIARYSFDLQNDEFARFARHFCQNFGLKDLEIRHIHSHANQAALYLGELKTRQNNATSAMSQSLHGILKDLSDKTISELVTAEYWSVNQRAAHNLLSVSSNLATISRILDKRFSPYARISQYNRMKALSHNHEDAKA